MQSVVETPAYLAAAREEGMTSDEMMAAVNLVAANPRAGDLIVGSGGGREGRVPGKGRVSRAVIAWSPSSAAKMCRCFFSQCCRRDREPTSQTRSARQ